jgi:hypothetical protein
MATFSQPVTVEIPRPRLGAAGIVAIVGLILLGLGALAGGIALVSQPDGSVMGFELGIIEAVSFLHPVFFVLGLVIAGAAVPWGWPTFQAWRASR